MLDKKTAKEKLLSVIDKAAFFFFAVLMLFLPVSNAVIESCFGFIFLLFILKLSLGGITIKDNKFFKSKINLLVLIFFLSIGLSLLVSGPLLMKSFKAWFFKWGEGVLLFYFAQILLRKRDIAFLLIPLFASTFLQCIWGLYQLQFNIIKGLSLSYPATLLNGVRAGFNHYNDFASFLTVVFFILLGALLKTKKTSLKIILGLLGILVTATILFTRSRGAWLAFLLINLLFGFIFYRKKKINLAYSMYIIIPFFIIAIFWLSPLTERLFYSFKIGGDSDRLKVWRISLSIFKGSPLIGTGIGLFMDRLPPPLVGPTYAHNCYLQILVETGIIGLFSFLVFLGTIIKEGFVRIIRDFDELFLGLFSAFLAFLIHSFFDTQLYSLKLSILFWLLASFVAIYLSEPLKRNTLSPSSPS